MADRTKEWRERPFCAGRVWSAVRENTALDCTRNASHTLCSKTSARVAIQSFAGSEPVDVPGALSLSETALQGGLRPKRGSRASRLGLRAAPVSSGGVAR